MKPKDIPGMAATPTLHAIVYLMKCRSQTCTHFRQEMNDKERRKNALRKARRQRKKNNSTRYSQAVTHPSTNRALRCLTSVFGREPVISTWYGRCRRNRQTKLFIQRYTETETETEMVNGTELCI